MRLLRWRPHAAFTITHEIYSGNDIVVGMMKLLCIYERQIPQHLGTAAGKRATRKLTKGRVLVRITENAYSLHTIPHDCPSIKQRSSPCSLTTKRFGKAHGQTKKRQQHELIQRRPVHCEYSTRFFCRCRVRPSIFASSARGSRQQVFAHESCLCGRTEKQGQLPGENVARGGRVVRLVWKCHLPISANTLERASHELDRPPRGRS